MSQKLLILENDNYIDVSHHMYVYDFREKWQGDIIELTGLRSREKSEIFKAVKECDTIVVQTCFVNGSDQQFEEFFELFKKIQTPKKIYLALLGTEIRKYFEDNLSDEQLFQISHHELHDLHEHWHNRFFAEENEKQVETRITFDNIVEPYLRKQKEKQKYFDSSKERKTGQKIKILSCNGFGKAFENLDIGSCVDEIEFYKYDENPSRGVWIYGNGEPIKLVNDCGQQEYEVVFNKDVTDQEYLNHICKLVSFNYTSLNKEQYNECLEILKEDIDPSMKANIFCEFFGIEKRYNRNLITNLIRSKEEMK